MDLGGIAKAVARFAPLLGGAIAGPGGAAIGQLVASAFGTDPDQPEAVVRAIEADPEAAVKLREIEARQRERLEALAVERARNALAADTARLQAVNATMRAEARAEDPWTRRWRPFWGFTTAIAFFVQVGAIAGLLFSDRSDAAGLITALGSLSVFWSVPLAILGVSAWHRGVEKRIRAGERRPGLAGLLGRGGG